MTQADRTGAFATEEPQQADGEEASDSEKPVDIGYVTFFPTLENTVTPEPAADQADYAKDKQQPGEQPQFTMSTQVTL